MDATATFALQIGGSAPKFSDLLGIDGRRYSLVVVRRQPVARRGLHLERLPDGPGLRGPAG
jgi:hypothetical protein